MCSWATTDGKYREEAITAGSSHFDEPTIMGLYTTMDSYIIADPSEPAKTHHLVAYWSQYTVSVYRYNHCYELPDLKIDDSTDVKTVSLYSDSTDLKNTLYLVPTDNEAITKFDFTDLLKVSYDEASETITYDDIRGNYYAVRGYTSDGKTKYYAVSRQVETVSTNSIEKQNPSARPHMTRANNNADHTTEHQDSDGMSWQGNVCGTKENPYDLYFYYDRESYTIRYVVPNTNENDPQTEDELGRIELPYGAHVTSEEYAFQLDYRDNNQNAEYGWTYLEGSEAVPVCPDRNPDGKTPWKFKGWGLGPAGANMLWEMPDDSHPEETQAQISDDFYIGSDLLLYAIWETPMLQVTFHLNGGQVSSKESIEVSIPSNTVYTAGGAIPRPVRNGYTLVGWYQSDEEGNLIGIKEEDLFNFDSVIIENQHVAAVWKEVETAKYNYNVYYVTQTLRDVDQERNLPTIQVDDRTGEIVKSGGTTYYVLDKDEKKDQMYVSGTALNLRATPQSGYTPRETTKLLELTDSNQSYNVIFFYDPWTTTGSYTVRFVEAGTEKKSDPTVVKTVQAEADQTVVTPGAAAVKEMTEKGYELVSRGADGKYTAVKEYQDLTWIDKDGKIQAMSTLAGTNIPDTVTYLVQPIAYTVTYQNAGGSPEAAGNALSALTAAENTPVNSAKDKNPTQYTTKDTFTLKNPTRVYDSGKWYQFSHWSLGDGTTVNPQQGAGETYTKLQVDPGTIGNLTFMANWEEVTDVGSLMVSKTVSGNQGDTSQKFTFTVTLGDTSIEGKYDEMTFHAGVATFTLKHGESVTAQNLPAGITYTVKETGNAGYTVTSSGEAGTIETGEKAIASFHNHKSGEDGSGEDKPTKPMKPTNLAETITPIEQSKLSSTTAVSPKTGDETNLTLWLAVLDLSGIGIIVILVAFRRHYKGK